MYAKARYITALNQFIASKEDPIFDLPIIEDDEWISGFVDRITREDLRNPRIVDNLVSLSKVVRMHDFHSLTKRLCSDALDRLDNTERRTLYSGYRLLMLLLGIAGVEPSVVSNHQTTLEFFQQGVSLRQDSLGVCLSTKSMSELIQLGAVNTLVAKYYDVLTPAQKCRVMTAAVYSFDVTEDSMRVLLNDHETLANFQVHTIPRLHLHLPINTHVASMIFNRSCSVNIISDSILTMMLQSGIYDADHYDERSMSIVCRSEYLTEDCLDQIINMTKECPASRLAVARKLLQYNHRLVNYYLARIKLDRELIITLILDNNLSDVKPNI